MGEGVGAWMWVLGGRQRVHKGPANHGAEHGIRLVWRLGRQCSLCAGDSEDNVLLLRAERQRPWQQGDERVGGGG